MNISVGIGDFKIAKNGDTLVTFALGSCVGICLYDDLRKVAGLSHIMLPSSQGHVIMDNKYYKYADIAIPALVKEMEKQGASRIRMTAKIAGGAHMFKGLQGSHIGDIGEKNVAATVAILNALRIKILVKDVGENYGRTQYFDSSTGIMKIKSVSRGEAFY